MKQLRFFLPLTVLLSFFVFIAPKFLQGGDTPELVMASFHRLVAHPPGYPLFIWLQFLWTHVFDVSTIFWRASILSSLLGIAALAAVLYPIRGFRIYPWIVILLVGLKPEFIEASVLPDVFSLHALFVALIGYFFLFSQHIYKHAWVIMLFVLSLTNHHTSIFLLPVFLYCLWYLFHKKNYRMLVYAKGLGSLGFIALYSSILFLNPKHPLSWGEVDNLQGLIQHFFRADYGTFQLAAVKSSTGAEAFVFFLKSLWPVFLVSITVCGIAIRNKVALFKEMPFVAWTMALIITVLFPLAMNVTFAHVGAEVLKRFHVMPLIVSALWTLYLLKKIDLTKKSAGILIISLLPALYSNLWSIKEFLSLRNDSVIEDYARNLYQISKHNQPALVVAETDTSYFALKFIQSFDKDEAKSNISIVSLPLFFHPWYLHKVQAQLSEFSLPRAEEIYQTRYINKDRDIIMPNLKNIHFFFTKGYTDGVKYQVTFFPLGRMLSEGEGVFFKELPITINTKPDINYQGPQAFTKLKLFYEYSHYDYARGVEKAQANDFIETKKSLEEAIKKVPYAYPALSSLCMNFPEQYDFCKSTELQTLEEKTKYFY